MLQVHRAIAVALVLAAAVADAQPSDTGVVVDVSGQKKGLYPIATPTAPDGDVAAEIAKVESFDLSVAGVFKVLDPKSFLADLKGEGLGLDPQKWKYVGAYGVIKYKASPTEIEFRLYEISKGTTPSLTVRLRRVRAGSTTEPWRADASSRASWLCTVTWRCLVPW